MTYTPLDDEQLRQGLNELAATDPDIERLAHRHGSPPLWPRSPTFATLIQIILEQQISLKAAETVFKKVEAALGGVSPDNILAAGESGLRALGITRQKSRYCHELALHVSDGRLPLNDLHTQSIEDGRHALLRVPGLGPWSVDVYYMSALRHPDIWPKGDLALAIAMQDIKQLPERPDHSTQSRIAEAWAPWRSVAARLLWMDYLVQRGQFSSDPS